MPKKQISIGSGFVVQDYILTNAHVISGAKYIRLKTSSMNQYVRPKVEFVDDYHDVALLKVDDPRFWQGVQPLEFSKSDVSLSTKLHVIGYPMGGNEICVTNGVASRTELNATAHYGEYIHKVQIDAAVNAGNSGGPVLCNNFVVGMIIDGIDGAVNINYMIPSSVLSKVIDAFKKQKSTKYKFDFDVTLISNQAVLVKLVKDCRDESVASIVGDFSIPPEIYQYKNLVFQQITDSLVKQLQESESDTSKELLGFNCKESSGIVISEFLDYEDFICYSAYLNVPITAVNNKKIKKLDDVRDALKDDIDMITISFANHTCILIKMELSHDNERPRLNRAV